MSANFELLGIDEEMLKAMEAERTGKATWLRPTAPEFPPSLYFAQRKKRPQPMRGPSPGWSHPLTVQRTATLAKMKASQVPICEEYGRRNKYPLRTMEVGQWFLVPLHDRRIKHVQDSVTTCVQYAQKKYGRKFQQRRTLLGVQVTRIA